MRALLEPRRTRPADVVEQRDAGVDQDLGAEVGIAAGDARRGVDDGGDPAADQRVGADPVDVDVVDDGDVAGAQPLGEVLRAAVEPDGAGDAGPRLLCPAAPKGADAHDAACFHAASDGRSVRRATATSQSRTVFDTTGAATRRAAPSGARAGPLPSRD